MFEDWKNKSESFDGDRPWQDFLEEQQRAQKIRDIKSDLIEFGIAQGYTDNQIAGALKDLFLVMSPVLYLYVLVDHPALAAAINDDVTLGWLDTDVQGVPLRQRLINRLS